MCLSPLLPTSMPPSPPMLLAFSIISEALIFFSAIMVNCRKFSLIANFSFLFVFLFAKLYIAFLFAVVVFLFGCLTSSVEFLCKPKTTHQFQHPSSLWINWVYCCFPVPSNYLFSGKPTFWHSNQSFKALN